MCLTNGGEGSYAIKKQPLTQTINEPDLPEEEGNLLRRYRLHAPTLAWWSSVIRT